MAALTTSAQPTDAQSGCAALSKDLLLATVMVTSADRTFGTCLVTKNQKNNFQNKKKESGFSCQRANVGANSARFIALLIIIINKLK